LTRLITRMADVDAQLFYYFNVHKQNWLLDQIMKTVTHLGGAAFTVTFTIVLITFGQSLMNFGVKALIALTGSHVLVQILKFLVNRPRPFLVLPRAVLASKPLKDYSFPSGHTAAAFSIATVSAMTYFSYSPLFLLLALIVGVSRVYLGLHYPSDVLVGSVLGAAGGFFSFLIL